MKKIVPDYYGQFRCIAGACRHNCCIGWEIDIDDDTYHVYQNIPGEFGRRLKQNMARGEEKSFILSDNRCPFLNDNGLCEIYLELGEDSLCTVCTEYPRFTEIFPGRIEQGIGLSCEEAARLLFSRKTPVTFEVISIEGTGETEPVDEALFQALLNARHESIRILQERSLPVFRRMAILLQYAKALQDAVNQNEPEKMETVTAVYRYKTFPEFSGQEQCEYMKQIVWVFEELEAMNDDWSESLHKIQQHLCAGIENEAAYCMEREKFFDSMQDNMYQYEHFAVYLIFRYFLKAVYDNDVLSKVKLAAVSLLMLQEMDFSAWQVNGGTFGLEERIENVRIYSEEIEHSEENLQSLTEAFLFHEVFCTEKLTMLLSLSK